MSMCASYTQFAISSRAGHNYEVVSITITSCTNATVLGSVGGVNHGRRCIADRHHPYAGSRRPKALWRLPAAREAASCDTRKSGIRGRGAGAAYGAKELARGGHQQRHGSIALNLLLKG